MVDKQGRSLIAEARARTQINGDPAILAHFPALDTKVPAEVIQQGRVVLHAVGDVIVEQHAVLADSARMEETIERCYAFHMSQGQAERAGDILEQIARKPSVLRLRLAKDLNQRIGIMPARSSKASANLDSRLADTEFD